uniref:Citrate transporter-like domain-containing protein n=1 Tax=Dunaliella tertiolecta TaxID=3047 RepID=A0A7S3VP57_DUNTE
MLLCAQAAITSCLYIATGALSEILTNNAAAALMYPIAAAAGDKLGVDPKLISVSIMLGASSAFMSPFGYQTNLMVYGAGNYKTMEFIKYGAGLKVGNGRAEGNTLLYIPREMSVQCFCWACLEFIKYG